MKKIAFFNNKVGVSKTTLVYHTDPATTDADPWCLGVMRHYQSLMPLAQDAQKPMFQLRPGDGAIGSHMDAVLRCRQDFARLAAEITKRLIRASQP